MSAERAAGEEAASRGPMALPPGRWVSVGGHPVHYREWEGRDRGLVFVCVHGLGGSHLNWAAVAPGLARRGRVLALDLAGFGLTPPTGRGTGIEANRRVVVDGFLRALDLPPAVLVGNSMGGMLCVIQCAHAPRSVDRMVLVDAALPRPPWARPEVRVAAFFALFAVPPVGRWISSTRPRRLGAERLVRRTLEVVAADPDRVDPAMVELLVEAARERMGLDHAARAFAEAAREVFLSQAFPSRYRAVARAARCPALVLHGTADRLVPVGSARAAVAEHPNWDLQVLEGLGHVPQMEAPELFLAAVEGWLDRRHAARSAPA